MKRVHRPAKSKGIELKVPSEAHIAPELNEAVSRVLRDIKLWFDSTQFDNDGFRLLRKQDFAEAEWNFSSITEPPESTLAANYEYRRECKDVYLSLAPSPKGQSLRAWNASAIANLLGGDNPVGPLDSAIKDFFPLPYVLLPEMVRAHMRDRWKCELVWEIDDEQELSVTQVRGVPMLTVHRVMISWHEGIKAARKAMFKWLDAVRPSSLKSKKGRPTTKCAKDALSQLAAWRARRAGLSHREYVQLLKDAGISPSSTVCAYSDPSAYRNAAAFAQKRISNFKH
jgi:hypothetical protein